MFKDDYKHKGLRRQLVKVVQNKGISDPEVLRAVGTVPRHYFFDNALIHHAYEDKAFPIGKGQTISQPYTVAKQSELLEIKPGTKVLEIGTGSGYQAAILAEMGANVYSVEVIPELHKRATKFLKTIGYKVNCYLGDGSLGFEKRAPYERIIVTAAAPEIPQSLCDQLAPGGILVIPVGNRSTQHMVKVLKQDDGSLVKKDYGLFAFVPLTGEEGWKK